MSDPQRDEHIEELLSKLQGIFGKLAHSEEEESSPTPESLPAPSPPPVPKAAPAPVTEKKESTPAPVSAGASGYQTTVPEQDPEKMIVPTAVFYPTGRETEARSAAQKLETITPKFTKVAFRLRVIAFTAYDPKSEWKEAIIAQRGQTPFQTVFVVMDRSLDDAKRKTIMADLEERGIYFQEVPTASIEKKAFYTDILLGLVFFFDSHRPSTGEQPQAS